MGPIRSPSGESARHEDAQKRLISATAAAQKRRVGGLAYESPAALRGWRSGEQAGTCSAVLGAAGESRERGRGWPPRAAKAKYRTIFSTGEATRRSNGPGQPREAAPRKSRKPRNVALADAMRHNMHKLAIRRTAQAKSREPDRRQTTPARSPIHSTVQAAAAAAAAELECVRSRDADTHTRHAKRRKLND